MALWDPRPVSIVSVLASGFNGLSGSAMPLAEGIYGSNHLIQVWDLSYFTQIRLCAAVATAGAAGAVIYLKYAADMTGASYPSALTGNVSLAAGGANTVAETGWTIIPVDARRELIVKLYGAGGDGVASPVIKNVTALLR